MMFRLQKCFNWELLQDEPHFREFLRNTSIILPPPTAQRLGGVRGFRIFADSNAFFRTDELIPLQTCIVFTVQMKTAAKF